MLALAQIDNPDRQTIAGSSTIQALNANGLCRFCPLLPTLFAVSRGDRDRVGDLGPGPGAGAGDRADQRVVCRVSGQSFGGPTSSDAASAVGVACGVCVERCPFGVEIIAKMREAAAMLEERAA
jgi:ferredoxin